MDKNEMLQKVSEETMIFMRGKYTFDEIGNGTDKLTFCENCTWSGIYYFGYGKSIKDFPEFVTKKQVLIC
jgi:hypothetical protein